MRSFERKKKAERERDHLWEKSHKIESGCCTAKSQSWQFHE